MICKLKECGTAFSRRLAIQFSKTELTPSPRGTSLESSLERRGVAKTTGCVKEGGFYHRRPGSVKRKFRVIHSKRLSTRGRPYLPRSPSPVNPFVEHRRLPFDFGVPAREAASSLLAGVPSSRTFSNLRLPFGFPEPAEGAASIPLTGAPSRGGGHFFLRPAPPPSCGGAAFYFHRGGRVKSFPKNRHRGARDHSASDATPFLQAIARSVAAGSGAPPRRDRSCAAIASRQAEARSSTSFTTT
jgi:hypothetical protein